MRSVVMFILNMNTTFLNNTKLITVPQRRVCHAVDAFQWRVCVSMCVT